MRKMSRHTVVATDREEQVLSERCMDDDEREELLRLEIQWCGNLVPDIDCEFESNLFFREKEALA